MEIASTDRFDLAPYQLLILRSVLAPITDQTDLVGTHTGYTDGSDTSVI